MRDSSEVKFKSPEEFLIISEQKNAVNVRKSCNVYYVKCWRIYWVRAVKSQLGSWSDSWKQAQEDFGRSPLEKFFRPPQKEGSAPFKTIYFKKLLTFLVKAVQKVNLRTKDIILC